MMYEVEILEDSKQEKFAAPDCHIKKDTNDEIKWINRTTKDCVLEFMETPFEQGKTFDVKKGDFTVSGPLRKDAKKEHWYAYEIRATVGAKVMAADPNVIVH